MDNPKTRFSANLGYLWAELALPDAIRAAANAGFHAVECHWPYDFDPSDVNAALAETGLSMLTLNTVRGEAGEFGLSALTHRVAEARAAIDQAVEYAANTGTAAVHVMAGNARGHASNATYLDNLQYACDLARPLGITILIEPLNKNDAPGYFLRNSAQALTVLKYAARSNLKLLFDCYHTQITEGDVINQLKACLPQIGHIQIASVPDRGPPETGGIDYPSVFQHLRELGYTAPLGAEYRPSGTTEASLGWMKS